MSRSKVVLALLVALALILGLALLGPAVLSAQGTTQTIRGCVNNKSGVTRILLNSASTCKSKETLVTWSNTGPPGPQGPAGVVGAGATQSIFVPSPLHSDSVWNFVPSVLTVDVAAGEDVFITANQAFGSTAAGGAGGLDLDICFQPAGGTIVQIGVGMSGLTIAQGERHDYGLSTVFIGLAPGRYTVGLCYSTSNPNWNSNDRGYVSAIKFNHGALSAIPQVAPTAR